MGLLTMRTMVAQSDAAMPEDSEIHVVRRAIEGEPGAFGVLYERYADRIYHFVYLRVRDSGLARDLTQDVFVSALRGMPGLHHETRFLNWLYRIAHNTVLNHWRRQSSRPRLVVLSAADGSADEPPDLGRLAGGDPHETIETRLRVDEVIACLRDLSESHQAVLTLRFVSGLSLAQTADVLGRSEDAVKKMQRRALVNLRHALEGRRWSE